MNKLAIIGGTGLSTLDEFSLQDESWPETPYGKSSAPLLNGKISGNPIIFLARHGNPHRIPPHRVNYRANLWALKESGADNIISINAVGGITSTMGPGVLACPDQLIDYTWSREHTFFDQDLDNVTHVDFSYPYSDELRREIIESANTIDINIQHNATYAATQGPRLETAAEIRRLQQDGCDLVGMTGMPEAALARELELEYASICLVVNWAAGKSDEIITIESIEQNLAQGMLKVQDLLLNIAGRE